MSTKKDIDSNCANTDSFIKTPRQLIAAVLSGFIVPIVIIYLLVTYVGSNTQFVATDKEASIITKRISPIARVELRDANAPKLYKTGIQIYEQICVACHASGVAGAPKFGDSTAWSPRISLGYDKLLKILLEGKGAMPARGGASTDISNEELGGALIYIVNASGGKFKDLAASK